MNKKLIIALSLCLLSSQIVAAERRQAVKQTQLFGENWFLKGFEGRVDFQHEGAPTLGEVSDWTKYPYDLIVAKGNISEPLASSARQAGKEFFNSPHGYEIIVVNPEKTDELLRILFSRE